MHDQYRRTIAGDGILDRSAGRPGDLAPDRDARSRERLAASESTDNPNIVVFGPEQSPGAGALIVLVKHEIQPVRLTGHFPCPINHLSGANDRTETTTMKPTPETHRATQFDVANRAFPHAPLDWSPGKAEEVAKAEGLTLTDDHWEVVHSLHEYFARHEGAPRINMRELHDALDEHFHARGGIKALYMLFPRGPIAQGCRVAGLKAPYLATDTNFGSVA